MTDAQHLDQARFYRILLVRIAHGLNRHGFQPHFSEEMRCSHDAQRLWIMTARSQDMHRRAWEGKKP